MEGISFKINFGDVISYIGTINEFELNVKQGLIKRSIKISAITNFYVGDSLSGKVMAIAYWDGEKKKSLEINFNDGDQEAQKLIDKLREFRGGCEIRGLLLKEAYKTMGLKTTSLPLTLLVLNATVIIALSIAFLPTILHILDKGEAQITVSDIASKIDLKSNNVALNGVPIANCVLEIESTYKGTITKDYFAPIVDSGWKQSDPIYVVGEFGEDKIDAVSNLTSFKGILRNILWEKKNLHEDFFKDNCGLIVAENAVLLEIDAKEPNVILVIVLVIIILINVCFLAAIKVLSRRGKLTHISVNLL